MAQPSPLWVGEQFTSKYYDVLEKLPKYLHRFYKEDSTFSVTILQPDGTALVESASGDLQAIEAKLMGTIANAVVSPDKALDAQFSQGQGVLLQVSGMMKLQGLDRKFVQVFFLATQEKGYYVLNDMLRIFAPEVMRPVENGFMAPHVPTMPPPAFEFVPPPIPAQLAPRVDMLPGVATGIPVAPAPVSVAPELQPAEQEALAQEEPEAAPAPVEVQVAVPVPVVAPAVPVPEPVAEAPEAPAVPVPQPVAAAQAQPRQAPPQQPAPAPAQPLSWAERARLASSAAASAPKPQTPAKAPQQPAPAAPAPVPVASALEAPAADASSAAPAASADGAADAQADAEAEASTAEPLAPEIVGSNNDPGCGVYVQGIPQHLSPAEVKKLLTGEFSQFGAFGSGGVNVVRSPRFGMVAYVFYKDEKSRDTALEHSGKLRLGEGDKPVKILIALPEFERGFAPRGGGRGDRGRGSSIGSGYRGGRGGYDGGRGRGGRGEGGRGDRPPSSASGRGGRGGERGGRGGGPGRGPRDPSSGPSAPKQA